jgi:hypothetical protein
MDRRIYIAVGDEGKQMVDDAKKLSSLITTGGKKKTKLSFVYLPAENHLTILHNAAYKGFEILFAK